MNRIKGIPESHFIFTDNGWELLSDITIDTRILTVFNKQLTWQKQDKFTKFDYKGLVTETCIRPSVYANIEPLVVRDNFTSSVVDKSVTKFYTKGYTDEFETLLLTHRVCSRTLVDWGNQGSLLMFSFPIYGKIFISNKEEYIII